MKQIIDQAIQVFKKTFSADPALLFQAPGRVNLIGEHTDYNGGFVLPCAIDRATLFAISPRDDDKICVIAAGIKNQRSEWQTSLPIAHSKNRPWSNYLRGVCEQYLKAGHRLKGMNIVALGNIPRGAGLSSSASFSVAFANAISHLNDINQSPTEIALICQAAENQFVGCQCGIMDQLISAAGKAGHALLIDCLDLSYDAISMPKDSAILIIDSKVTRGLVESEYNTRRQQCEAAVAALGLRSLREATMQNLNENKAKIDDAVYRRARHIISENDRTVKSAEALKTANYTTLSQLMAQSHNSMRDDFEITVPQIDFLVEKISETLGDRGGARMTGGGFGGCVVALAPEHLADEVISTVHNSYSEKTGLKAEIHLCKASDGAGLLLETP